MSTSPLSPLRHSRPRQLVLYCALLHNHALTEAVAVRRTFAGLGRTTAGQVASTIAVQRLHVEETVLEALSPAEWRFVAVTTAGVASPRTIARRDQQAASQGLAAVR